MQALNTNCKNVFGGFGGIMFDPKHFMRSSKSAGDPDNPKKYK